MFFLVLFKYLNLVPPHLPDSLPEYVAKATGLASIRRGINQFMREEISTIGGVLLTVVEDPVVPQESSLSWGWGKGHC